jgi:hypothetical protein
MTAKEAKVKFEFMLLMLGAGRTDMAQNAATEVMNYLVDQIEKEAEEA